ncbi:hypothetical protein [Streptomyces sp. NPDC052225]|uniref:hypothetical protein n=1 Tax=Streptomyces sp. NPDC052225 TaxID=3154949 RepID=UPI00342C771C
MPADAPQFGLGPATRSSIHTSRPHELPSRARHLPAAPLTCAQVATASWNPLCHHDIRSSDPAQSLAPGQGGATTR